MTRTKLLKRSSCLFCLLLALFTLPVNAQVGQKAQWNPEGTAQIRIQDGEIIQTDLITGETQRTWIQKSQLIPEGESKAILPVQFSFSEDREKILLFTNTKRVWRYHTRGDYWVYDLKRQQLTKLGNGLPAASLKFAKFSPKGNRLAYVSENNLYWEELGSGQIHQLTFDGDPERNIINGTFDWAYEEEFGTRDGFRWSTDGSQIAFWKIDGSGIRNYLMLNTTDDIYSYTIPVEYPKVGQNPSAASIWTVRLEDGESVKMQVPGDPQQHYLTRMEWHPGGQQIIVQQLNRKQNKSRLLLCQASSGKAEEFYVEEDEAWIDIKSRWNHDDPSGWEWINGGQEFIWLSEAEGWRQLYRIDLQGRQQRLIPDDYDVIQLDFIDHKAKKIYFTASPDNATERYLYAVDFKGGHARRLSPAGQAGTNQYQISPNGTLALRTFSAAEQYIGGEIIDLASHKVLREGSKRSIPADKVPEFFQITTEDGVELDGWMIKPSNFDPSKKYPVLFFVYGEPAGQTVVNRFGIGGNGYYKGNLADDGYLYISLENRGTPVPKGRAWRKSIYRKIGIINTRDQAMGAREILKWPFVDASRIAVWGSSGGGSATLNLLSQFPEIYQTGISIAAVASQLLYNNIYQERYMGLPQENLEDFVQGSPLHHIKNLQGNLLYIHGTGDDNVHYQNAEVLLNELIKYNKQFEFMSYPNRSHSLSEGEGTHEHLSTLFTNFLQKYCEPGGR